MVRRFTTAQFVRASFQLLLVLLSFGVALIGAIAFAQDVLPAPAAPATTGDTVLGYVLKGALVLLILIGSWAAKKLTDFLAAKVQQTNQNGAQSLAWSLTNKLWLKAQAAGAKILAKEKDLLDKILSDGVVTAEEFKTFQTAIAGDLRDIAAEEIPMLGGLIGGTGPVSTLVEGFASKVAHQLISGQQAGPTQSPVGQPVPAPAAVPQ